MPTVTIEAQLSPDDILSAVAQMDAPELDLFANRVLALRAARIAPSVPTEETELLRQINQQVPADIQKRYDALRRRRDAETLSKAEYSELQTLTEQIEQRDADRLQRLADLARLRQKPLRVLIAELGLHPHDYEK